MIPTSLTATRVSQDEVQITCRKCSYLHAVPLTLSGKYDGQGREIEKGTCRRHGLDAVLTQPVPAWRPGHGGREGVRP